MTEQKINKSDYTDSNNKVWESVGENIRKGSKNLKTTFDNIVPSQSICLPFVKDDITYIEFLANATVECVN